MTEQRQRVEGNGSDFQLFNAGRGEPVHYNFNFMNTDLLLLKTYFGWTSLINSEKAARKSFRLFQKVQKKNIRRRETGFFASSRKFQVWTVKENIDCFEIGNPNGEVVILVHGWDSNAFVLFSKRKRDL